MRPMTVVLLLSCQGRAADLSRRCLSLASSSFLIALSTGWIFRCCYCCCCFDLLSLIVSLDSAPPDRSFVSSAHGCALAREILIHGRIYVSATRVYFKSNILGYKTLLDFPLKSVVAIGPRMTALVIPNSLELVCQSGDVVRPNSSLGFAERPALTHLLTC